MSLIYCVLPMLQQKRTQWLMLFSYRRLSSTMYKNNSQNSSKFKGCSPLQLSCNLIGKCNAIGYYSYTNRYEQFNKKKPPEVE